MLWVLARPGGQAVPTRAAATRAAMAGISAGWDWGFASPYCSGRAHGDDYADGNQVLDNYVHSDGLGDGNGNTVEAECIYTLGGQGDGNGSVDSVLADNVCGDQQPDPAWRQLGGQRGHHRQEGSAAARGDAAARHAAGHADATAPARDG